METIIVTPMLAVLTLMEVFHVCVFLGILEKESTAKVWHKYFHSHFSTSIIYPRTRMRSEGLL